MLRNYLELGGYGSFDKPQDTSGLSDLSAFDVGKYFSMAADVVADWIDPEVKEVKEVKDADGNIIVAGVAGNAGLKNNELYKLGKDVGSSVANDLLASATTEKEKQAVKDNAVRQAESILSQYNNMNCDTMTDKEKQQIASALAQYSGMFETLGIFDKLIPIIQKYNIPSCKLPDKQEKASSTDSKKMLVPAGVGVAGGVAAYYFKKSWLLSIAVAAAAGGATYYFMNQEKQNAKA